MTKDTEDASPTVTRRYVLMGGAALAAIAVAGGAGYYLWTQPDTAVAQPAAGGAEVPIGELMTPGPLGDQVQQPEVHLLRLHLGRGIRRQRIVVARRFFRGAGRLAGLWGRLAGLGRHR